MGNGWCRAGFTSFPAAKHQRPHRAPGLACSGWGQPVSFAPPPNGHACQQDTQQHGVHGDDLHRSFNRINCNPDASRATEPCDRVGNINQAHNNDNQHRNGHEQHEHQRSSASRTGAYHAPILPPAGIMRT